jgi:hypothetical protein
LSRKPHGFLSRGYAADLGIAAEARELEEHEAAGAERAVFGPRAGPRDEVERQLESIMAAVG